MLAGSADYVDRHPVATKRVLRAILKAADICASDPELAAQLSVDGEFTDRYDYALEGLREARYDVWREFDPEDTMRFYALRMNEVGFIKAEPEQDHRERHGLALPQRDQARDENVSAWPARILLLALMAGPAHAHDAPHDERLPTIGQAPDFTLVSQDGATSVAARLSRQGRRRRLHLYLLHRRLPDADRPYGQRAGEAGFVRSAPRSPSFRSPSTRSATRPRC